MLILWIAALSSCFHQTEYSKQSKTALQCSEGAREIERSLARTRLNEAKLEAFEQIARSRMERGLEVLPGMVGCGSISFAAAEVEQDSTTRALLVRHKLTSGDYMMTGWAAIIAVDPEAWTLGELRDSELIRHNRNEARKRQRLMSLMFGN